jgi:hypothetical protein
MKITIETDGAPVQTIQAPAEVSGATGAAPSAGAAPSLAAAPAGGGGTSLADLLAKAASMGAINAGPAPSLNSGGSGPAPIANSIGGAAPEASILTASAGSPPPHVYDPKGGCK